MKTETANTTIKIGDIKDAVAAFKKTGSAEKNVVHCKLNEGLYVRLQRAADGSIIKNYMLRYDSPVTGKTRRPKIASCDAISPAEAAGRAVAMKRLVDEGIDPLEKKDEKRTERKVRAAREHKTLADVLDHIWRPHLTKTFTKRIALGSCNLITPPSAFKSELDRDVLNFSEKVILDWNERQPATQRGTRLRALRELKRVLNYLVTIGYISSNPIADVKLPAPTAAENRAINEQKLEKEQADERKYRALEPEEVEAFDRGLERWLQVQHQMKQGRYLKAGELHWFEVFNPFGQEHGMRPQDIYRLEWHKHLDLDKQQLRFLPMKSLNNPEPPIVEHDLSDEQVEQLRRWHQQNGSPKRGFVFASETSEEGHITDGTHNGIFNEILEHAELPVELSFYCWRHHVISTLLLGGYPERAVADFVGHKTTRMINDRYFRFIKASKQGALELIRKSLNKPA